MTPDQEATVRRHLTPVVLSILALIVAACGRVDGPDVAEPAPTGTSTAAAHPTERCANPRDGYHLSYPEGWHTNPGDVLPTCRVFDTEPIDLVEGTEVPFDVTVFLDVVDRPISDLDLDDVDDDPATHVVERDEERIADREAVGIRFRATGEGLLPQGVTGHRFLVRLGQGTTLIASTYELDERPLAANVDTVRRMLQTLETTGGDG